MTPAEKRLKTINKKYGSVSQMLAKRDVRDLILGGYNGGIQTGRKGYATWDKEELKSFVETRERDSKGRFIAKTEVHTKGTSGDKGR